MKISIRLVITMTILCTCIFYYVHRKKTSGEVVSQISQTKQLSQKNSRIIDGQTNLASSKEVDDVAMAERIQSLWGAKNYEGITRAYGKWIFESPEAAIDFVANLTPPITPAYFVPDIKLYFDTISPQEAMELTLKLANDSHVQESASVDSFSRWLEEDRIAPLDWLFEHQNQTFTESLAERVARLGHLGNPSQVLKQLLQRDEGVLQGRLLKGVLINLLYKDQDAAIDFLNGVSASPFYDEAITAYTDDLVSTSPVRARLWADSIENINLKTTIMNQIKPKWTDEEEVLYQDATKSEES